MIKTITTAIAKRREEGESEKGFTLIELLVVVLIIGILAAIAIPAFLSQRESAWVQQVQSDLKNASLAAETYANTKGGSYANFDLESIDRAVNGGFNKSADTENLTFVPGANDVTYTISANNKNTPDRTFTFDSEKGSISETN